MATQVVSLFGVLTLDNSQFNSALDNAKTKADNFGTRLNSAANVVSSVGTKMMGAGGLILGALGLATAQAISFDDAFANVAKTVDGTDDELTKLRDKIREMATDQSNPLSSLDNAHEQIASIVALGGQLGVPIENLAAFAQTVGELGVSTEIPVEELGLIVGQISNVANLDPKNLNRFASALTNIGNNAATQEGPVLDISKRIASAGTNAGLHITEMLGFAASISETGMNAEAGGTAFATFITDMNTGVNNGGSYLRTLADVAGTTADEFETAWKEDAAGALLMFLEGFNELPPNLQADVLDELGASGSRMQLMLQNLSSDVEGVADNIQIAREGWITGAAATEEAGKKAETTGAKLRNLKNNMKDLGIQIGDSLTPIIDEFVDNSLTPFVQGLTGLVDENPQIVGAVLGLGSGLLGLGIAMRLAAGIATTFLIPALGLLTSPILAGVAAGVLLYTQFEDTFQYMRTSVEDFVNGFGDRLDTVGELIQIFIDNPLAFLQTAWGMAKDYIWGIIEDLSTKFSDWIDDAIGRVGDLVNTVFGATETDWEAIGRAAEMPYSPGIAGGSTPGGTGGAHAAGGQGSTQMDPFGALFGRASGGDVNAGTPYVVGEEGPEIFISGRSGTIIPNHALGGITITGPVHIFANDVPTLYDQLQKEGNRRARR